ncbi:MAG: triosephosphate isomerase [Candidatus Diapherotrites archaeon]|nr:triosephosphate isomerase [Candidatus Diapherotrites archaeon]
MKPLIVVNLKTYQQGKKTIELAKKIEQVDPKIIVGAQASDIFEITKKTKLKVYAQHVDPYKPERHTGYIIPEAVKRDKATGTFLNHSEHKIIFPTLKKTIKRCKKVGLKTMVFVANLKQAKKIEKLHPDYLIYEPPELVAGKVSVSKAKPEVIKNFSKKIKTKFLVGAGIKNNQDVKVAMKLGAAGVALSSAVTKSKNPKKVLRDLMK